MDENGNGRTLARLDERTELMQHVLDEIKSDLKHQLAGFDERLRCVETRIATHEEQQNTVNRLQTALSVVLSAIAAYIGGTR